MTVKKGIASVQNNAAGSGQFEVRENKKGESYFVLKAKNRQVIGTSESYSGKSGMNNGIKSVSKNGPKAKMEDSSQNRRDHIRVPVANLGPGRC